MMQDLSWRVVLQAVRTEPALRVVAPGTTVCDNLFKFVSARDPEYYREFKKVAFK